MCFALICCLRPSLDLLPFSHKLQGYEVSFNCFVSLWFAAMCCLNPSLDLLTLLQKSVDMLCLDVVYSAQPPLWHFPTSFAWKHICLLIFVHHWLDGLIKFFSAGFDLRILRGGEIINVTHFIEWIMCFHNCIMFCCWPLILFQSVCDDFDCVFIQCDLNNLWIR